MARARRYFFVPELAWNNAHAVRAADVAGGARQEAGLTVGQASRPASGTPPRGDIRPLMTGTPERHTAGTLAVTKAGVTDFARFGWLREGDDPDTDLQIRQSPMVVGRRTDIIDRQTPSSNPQGLHNRPKLLSLRSGDALCLWIQANRAPIFARNGYEGGLYTSKLDRATDRWGDPALTIASAATTGTSGSERFVADYIVAGDFIQFPDSGEIILCVLTQDSMTAPADRRLYVFHSIDDGTTWEERARLFLGGAIPNMPEPEADLRLDADGDGDTDDASPITACAVERLDSGRLVLMLHTEGGLWSLVSDTRGETWRLGGHVYNLLADEIDAPGHGVDIHRLRNGMLAYAAGRNRALVAGVVAVGVTGDGVSFSTVREILADLQCTDAAATVRPDGFPTLYGTLHIFRDVGDVMYIRDWLWCRSARTREPNLRTTEDDWTVGATPARKRISERAFHVFEDVGAGATTGAEPELFYGGFLGVAAIEHRGQVLMVAQWIRQDTESTGTDPTTIESAMVCYRLNYWQPLQERLTDAYIGADSGPGDPVKGRVYNRTWDAYTLPNNVGFSLVQTGGSTGQVDGGSHGGYVSITTDGGAARYYQDTTLPSAAKTLTGVVRALVFVSLGGSLTADDIVAHLRLRVGSDAYGVKVRFYDDASDLYVAMFDEQSGGQVGITVKLARQQWVEVLFSISPRIGGGVDAHGYCRAYDRTNDVDWLCPYGRLTDGAALSSIGSSGDELLRFGHISGSSNEAISLWKSVHLHRTDNELISADGPLVQRGVDWRDTESANNTANSGNNEAAHDAGVDNYMRTSQMTATPTQWLTSRVQVSWAGEAQTEGLYDFNSHYRHGRQNLNTLPVMQDWRSVDDGPQTGGVELVFQAAGPLFTPDALALFGRNFPGCTLQLNDTDSWSNPAVSLSFRVPGMASADRLTHLWALNPAGGVWTYEQSGHKLRAIHPLSSEPWRPGQFASVQGGPTYYLAAVRSSSTVVYGIVDNTGDTLTLDAETVGGDFGPGATKEATLAIFSDRFAVTLGGVVDNMVGYEYARLLIDEVTFRSASPLNVYRLGYMLLGQPVEIGDVQWGYSRGTAAGSDLGYRQSGASSLQRRHAPRRTLNMSYAELQPAEEASDVLHSPTAASARWRWQNWQDVVQRLEVNRWPVAVVFDEGDRARHAPGHSSVQVASDPHGLMMARVTNAGEVEHAAYQGRTLNLGDGDACVPRPIAAVRGIELTEEL